MGPGVLISFIIKVELDSGAMNCHTKFTTKPQLTDEKIYFQKENHLKSWKKKKLVELIMKSHLPYLLFPGIPDPFPKYWTWIPNNHETFCVLFFLSLSLECVSQRQALSWNM